MLAFIRQVILGNTRCTTLGNCYHHK